MYLNIGGQTLENGDDTANDEDQIFLSLDEISLDYSDDENVDFIISPEENTPKSNSRRASFSGGVKGSEISYGNHDSVDHLPFAIPSQNLSVVHKESINPRSFEGSTTYSLQSHLEDNSELSDNHYSIRKLRWCFCQRETPSLQSSVGFTSRHLNLSQAIGESKNFLGRRCVRFLGAVSLYAIFMCLMAASFQAIEKRPQNPPSLIPSELHAKLEACRCLSEDDLTKLVTGLAQVPKIKVKKYIAHAQNRQRMKDRISRNTTDYDEHFGAKFVDEFESWSFSNALIFCVTVATTIGFGHIVPQSAGGKVLCIIFTCFSIPFTLHISSLTIDLLMPFIRRSRNAMVKGVLQHCCAGASSASNLPPLSPQSLLHQLPQKQRHQQQQRPYYSFSSGPSLSRIASVLKDCNCHLDKPAAAAGNAQRTTKTHKRSHKNNVFQVRSMKAATATSSSSPSLPSSPTYSPPGRVNHSFDDADAANARDSRMKLRRKSKSLTSIPDVTAAAVTTRETKSRTSRKKLKGTRSNDLPKRKHTTIVLPSEILSQEATATVPSQALREERVKGLLRKNFSTISRVSVIFNTRSRHVSVVQPPLTLTEKLHAIRWSRSTKIRLLHLFVVIVLVVGLFIVLPAIAFDLIEPDWDILEAIYFCFMSLTTIGFGDYVPGGTTFHINVSSTNLPEHTWVRELYNFAIVVYMLTGTTMLMLVVRVYRDFIEVERKIKRDCLILKLQHSLTDTNLPFHCGQTDQLPAQD